MPPRRCKDFAHNNNSRANLPPRTRTQRCIIKYPPYWFLCLVFRGWRCTCSTFGNTPSPPPAQTLADGVGTSVNARALPSGGEGFQTSDPILTVHGSSLKQGADEIFSPAVSASPEDVKKSEEPPPLGGALRTGAMEGRRMAASFFLPRCGQPLLAQQAGGAV